MNEPTITVVGNLVAEPELKFLATGTAVANFTIAQTPRIFNREDNTWDDGETLFMRCSVFGQVAENLADSLDKGHHVVATGRLKQRSWENDEGEKRTIVEMTVDEVGASLRFATATVNKAERKNAGTKTARARKK